MIRSAFAAVQHVHDNHPVWNWIFTIGTAVLGWLQPLVALATLGWLALQAYIAWQKYQHWQKTKDSARK